HRGYRHFILPLSLLTKMTDIAFDLPLEFQRAYRLGPKRKGGTSKPRPIIACLLRHGQACQLLSGARAHGPFQAEGYEIRITADYSKETSDRRKVFLALRPRMCQLEVKYGLFKPARLWVTKNYDPEDLQLFLDSLQPQSIDTTTPDRLMRPPSANRSTSLPPTTQGEQDLRFSDHQLRGKDLERLVKTHDDRGQVLQAVALHIQLSDRQILFSPKAHFDLHLKSQPGCERLEDPETCRGTREFDNKSLDR
ncbi:hypothetical protein NDU88_001667, partial [Pleurodeles waltl]